MKPKPKNHVWVVEVSSLMGGWFPLPVCAATKRGAKKDIHDLGFINNNDKLRIRKYVSAE